MYISVTKLTDVELLRKANAFTSGSQYSTMSLEKAYSMGHSPIRTQLFWIEMRDIPLSVASHFVRHNVGVVHFQRSRRPDRGGNEMEKDCKLIEDMTRTALMVGCSAAQMNNLLDGISSLPKNYGRNSPTDLAMLVNAEALMNIAHRRLCSTAESKTREVMEEIRRKIEEVDLELAKHLVPMCAYRRGICTESKSCGINKLYKSKKDEDTIR